MMNERIKELALQAGFFPERNWDHTSWHAAGYNDTFEKFAELIVRECILELEISRKGDKYTGDLFDCGYNTCINEQITMLKEHFGVEE